MIGAMLRVLFVAALLAPACGGSQPPGSPPVAVLTAPTLCDLDTEMKLDASRSTDPDGDIVLYRFVVADGTAARDQTQPSPSVGHVCRTAGLIEAAVQVIDAQGESRTGPARSSRCAVPSMRYPLRHRAKLGRLLAALTLLSCCAPHRGQRPPAVAGAQLPPQAVPAAGSGPSTRVQLTILTTNDFHGQLEPLRRYTDEPSPRAYRVGGAEALAATIAELRAADPQGSLLLDGGDFMQGSLLSNHYEGAPVGELFKLLSYNAVAVGNHEFDYGPVGAPDAPPGSGADPRGALRAWISRAAFPVLSANLHLADGSSPTWTNFHASALVRRRGVAVGLIGLTTPETAVTTMPAFAEGLVFEAWLPAVLREARQLRARGAQLVILLAHGEAECRRPDASSCRGELFTRSAGPARARDRRRRGCWPHPSDDRAQLPRRLGGGELQPRTARGASPSGAG